MGANFVSISMEPVERQWLFQEQQQQHAFQSTSYPPSQPILPDNVKEYKIDVEWTVTDMFFVPEEYAEAHADEENSRCELTVYLQSGGGNMQKRAIANELKEKIVVLTVHDVGTNPLHSFIPLVNSPAMAKCRQNAIFLHVCVPGQESWASDFCGNFPTMEQLSELLPQVLSHFGVKRCIGLGEGAGADILCRFALLRPDLLHGGGIVLVQCDSAIQGILENLKEIFTNLQIDDGKMNSIAWNYLMLHKYGQNQKEQRDRCCAQIERMALNEHNLSRYLYSFSYRTDFTDMIKQKLLKVRTILVSGSKSPHNKNVMHMYEQMDKTRTTLLMAESCADIIREAPEYIGQALALLCYHWPVARPNSTSPSQPQSPSNEQNTLSAEQEDFKDSSTSTLRHFDMETST